MKSFIYIISGIDTKKPCKIGRSASPEKRVKQLQTGHPEKLKLFYYHEFDSKITNKIEKIIHKRLNHKRLNKTEFFDISVEEAILEIQFAEIKDILKLYK